MYIVIELQKTGEQLGNLVTAHQTLAEAEAKYHAVLAAAATSSVEAHSAILVNAYGIPLKNECYRHDLTDNAE